MTQDDPRTGPRDSGQVTVTSANGNAPQTAYTIPDDALFRVDRIEWQYASAGTTTAFGVHDDADGTTNGNVSDVRHEVIEVDADTGDSVEMGGRIFEEDVLIVADGNNDVDLEVTVFGTKLTDLRDMTSHN